MADLWGTSRLLLTTFGLIFSQLFSASATLHVLNNVTWDTAFYTCHQHGEQLYSTSDITSLSDVTAGSYWIGAKVQYSSWMWTDNTPLFSYIGEVNEHPESEQIYQIKYNNQASRCYYRCQQNKTTANVMYVGLQREKCYCFNSRSWNRISHESVQTENKTGCLGNFKENCGTENTMSIYKTDLTISYVTWLFAGDGFCGYIEQSVNISVKTDKNCNTQRGFVCDCTGNYNNASCYHHDKTHSWFSANSTCSLTKLNKNNTELIRRELNAGVQYWIGLKRDRQIVWFDSFYNETLKINTTQNGCVLLTKFSNSSIIFSIQKCSDVQSAICTNNASFPTSNLPSSETYKTSPGFTFDTSTLTDKFTTQTDQSSTGSTKTVLRKTKSSNSDVAVGVSVTVVILLVACAIVALVYMKRKNIVCFQQKSADVIHNNSNNSVTTTTVTETVNSAISDSNYERLNTTQSSQNEYMNVPRETEHVYCVIGSNAED